jgi:hypothetical protein
MAYEGGDMKPAELFFSQFFILCVFVAGLVVGWFLKGAI